MTLAKRSRVKNFGNWGWNTLSIDRWTGPRKANNLLLKSSNDFEFIIVGSKLYQASIVNRENEYLKVTVLQLKKELFLFLIL